MSSSKYISTSDVPIEIQLVFIARLYWPGLRQVLNYLNCTVELSVDDAIRVHCGVQSVLGGGKKGQ